MRKTTPRPIGELLDELFRSPDIAAKIAEGSLPDTWRKVVGPKIAGQTRCVRLVRGTLYVHLFSSVMRSELMIQRHALVKAINDKAGMEIVRDIVLQ